ncbi:hypothetical protein PBRA_002131 [Plasmodiophora brassicae]|uniref:Uncharacterized protein n=1 Tax=Plasmodiophora brassicae TaxID=37360 RepID=A0A0G4J1S9_PLABS|nr:hypothetical protein PBRA_002131 [Plasmodiophora brassicae]
MSNAESAVEEVVVRKRCPIVEFGVVTCAVIQRNVPPVGRRLQDKNREWTEKKRLKERDFGFIRYSSEVIDDPFAADTASSGYIARMVILNDTDALSDPGTQQRIDSIPTLSASSKKHATPNWPESNSAVNRSVNTSSLASGSVWSGCSRTTRSPGSESRRCARLPKSNRRTTKTVSPTTPSHSHTTTHLMDTPCSESITASSIAPP